MDQIHEGLPYKDFIKPQTGIVEATVCSVSGQLLTSACGNHKTTQVFLEGTEPITMCTLHITREIDKIISIDRLRNELVQTGNVMDTSNLKGISLDLSFLEGDYDFANTAINQSSTSSGNNLLFELDDISSLPTTNYLLD